MMTPERMLEHADTVRQAYQAERKLRRLAPKLDRNPRLAPFVESLAAKVARLRGEG